MALGAINLEKITYKGIFVAQEGALVSKKEENVVRMVASLPVSERVGLLQLRQALEKGEEKQVRAFLSAIEAADAAALLRQLAPKSCLEALKYLPAEEAAHIISFLEEEALHAQLRELPLERLVAYLPYLASDDAADLLMMFPPKVQQEALQQLPEEEKVRNIEELLRYGEDVAGGLMAKELLSCEPGQSVAECRELLRKQSKSSTGALYVFYVVDKKGAFLGTLAFSAMLAAEDNMLVEALYKGEPIFTGPYAHKREVARLMRKYNLETLPVVNSRGRLLGRITVDDVLDVQEELAEKDQTLMVGLSSHVEGHEHPWRMLWARLPWLFIGLLGGLLAAQLMSLFEQQLIVIPALLFFVPLLTSTSGNVGIQSALSMVQAFAHGQVQGPWLWGLFGRLCGVALLAAIFLALPLAGGIFFIYQEAALVLAVGLSLAAAVLAAALLGAWVPLLLRRLGLNPMLATGPFLTTLNDVLGIAIYLGVAKWVYGLAI